MSGTENASLRLRPLRTLGALSAAGLAMTQGGDADAAVVVTTVNQSYGFGPGDSNFEVFDLPGANDFAIGAFTSFSLAGIAFFGYPSASVPSSGFILGVFSTFGYPIGSRLDAGQTIFEASGPSTFAFVNIASSSGTVLPGGTFTDKYFGFIFEDTSLPGDPIRFGWIRGSLTDDSYGGMSFFFHSYAYDDTGAVIPMGYVPEPSTLVSGLLGALILGAAGVRRWKAERATG